jgi:hypothetical protein
VRSRGKVGSTSGKKKNPPVKTTGGTPKGKAPKLGKRSEVVQARRGRPSLNVGDASEESRAARTRKSPQQRPKSRG